jgi:hypothetical protein
MTRPWSWPIVREIARPAMKKVTPPVLEFGKLIADETEKWGKVIRAANIRAM